MKSINVFIDTSLEVQLWSKWNYMINMYNQPINSSILKSLCQVKQETYMNKMIVEEGLTRTWPRWTMHQRRANGVLASRYWMWWRRASGCLIRGIKLAMKNHISLSVNLYWIKIWSDWDIKSGNWSYSVKYYKSWPLRVNAEAKSSVATLMNSREMKWKESILCKLKFKKCILYSILSIDCCSIKRDTINCQQCLNAQHSLKTQVRWVKHNSLIHYTTH
jgi:hypothetical protein